MRLINAGPFFTLNNSHFTLPARYGNKCDGDPKGIIAVDLGDGCTRKIGHASKLIESALKKRGT